MPLRGCIPNPLQSKARRPGVAFSPSGLAWVRISDVRIPIEPASTDSLTIRSGHAPRCGKPRRKIVEFELLNRGRSNSSFPRSCIPSQRGSPAARTGRWFGARAGSWCRETNPLPPQGFLTEESDGTRHPTGQVAWRAPGSGLARTDAAYEPAQAPVTPWIAAKSCHWSPFSFFARSPQGAGANGIRQKRNPHRGLGQSLG